MPIVGGLDIHRKQLTFDYLDTATGEVKRGQVASPEPPGPWFAPIAPAGHDPLPGSRVKDALRRRCAGAPRPLTRPPARRNRQQSGQGSTLKHALNRKRAHRGTTCGHRGDAGKRTASGAVRTVGAHRRLFCGRPRTSPPRGPVSGLTCAAGSGRRCAVDRGGGLGGPRSAPTGSAKDHPEIYERAPIGAGRARQG